MEQLTDFAKTGKLYSKIDIFTRERGSLVYRCTTQQWRTCRDAAQSWADQHTSGAVYRADGVRLVVARKVR